MAIAAVLTTARLEITLQDGPLANVVYTERNHIVQERLDLRQLAPMCELIGVPSYARGAYHARSMWHDLNGVTHVEYWWNGAIGARGFK